MNKTIKTILFIFIISLPYSFGKTIPRQTNFDFDYKKYCSTCLVSLSNLMMAYECDITEITSIECVKFVNNNLGALICGNIFETAKHYIEQQCMNQVEIPIIARNIAVGICYHLCEV